MYAGTARFDYANFGGRNTDVLGPARLIDWKRFKLAIERRLKNGLIDPFAEEKEGTAYIVDGDVERSNQGAVMNYLHEKYGLQQAMNIDMGMMSAAILVPRT